MQDHWDSVLLIALPLTIMNMIGTAVVIITMKCVKRSFRDNRLISELKSSPDTSTSSVSDNEHSDNDKFEKDDGAKRITDDDLIAHIRDSSVLPVVEDDDVSPRTCRNGENLVDSNDRKIRQSNAVASRNEIMGEQASLESTANSLIDFTMKMAGSLDSTNLPADKKQDLAQLLQGLPGLFTRIVDMDDNEVEEILQRKPSNTSSENSITDSEFLMKTLESLKV
jgi:hypothetical protein